MGMMFIFIIAQGFWLNRHVLDETTGEPEAPSKP
jgi:intracellular septation protein A